MTKYEQLLEKARRENLTVFEKYDLSETRLKGLYYDGAAALSKELRTNAEKNCILSEELGHHLTSTGNILDLGDKQNLKQELKARVWAYDQTIGLSRIAAALQYGCANLYEIAEYLNVTEEFFAEALNYYQSKYGLCAREDNYIIYFEPLGILKICR